MAIFIKRCEIKIGIKTKVDMAVSGFGCTFSFPKHNDLAVTSSSKSVGRLCYYFKL
jgi:hypothetical protein